MTLGQVGKLKGVLGLRRVQVGCSGCSRVGRMQGTKSCTRVHHPSSHTTLYTSITATGVSQNHHCLLHVACASIIAPCLSQHPLLSHAF